MTWEQVTLGPSGTSRQLWELAVQKYYEATLLDEEQLDSLRRQFTSGSSMTAQLPAGERISLATTRLTMQGR
ncbi:hypothetical protein [Nocardia terpenica]|uniref:Uncharacterized protein n=1 Tax=Nocardia terpenica TaxID=455432 RepID=A0A6G9Z930_9NOCA|nr:hypothetical protein [Nocardia terpenica]QIS22105.1 hypothetical protein F6W96_30930 [Nocardia terpenica]